MKRRRDGVVTPSHDVDHQPIMSMGAPVVVAKEVTKGRTRGSEA